MFVVCFQGHRIEEIPEVPLVISDKIEELKKTKEAVGVLRKIKAWADIEKVSFCPNLDFLGNKMMIFTSVRVVDINDNNEVLMFPK